MQPQSTSQDTSQSTRTRPGKTERAIETSDRKDDKSMDAR
jgi:hypothetical protein